MKNNLRKLNYLSKKFLNPNDFYVINIYSHCIQFQGAYKSELIKELTKKKFQILTDTGHQWILLNRSNIEITLT